MKTLERGEFSYSLFTGFRVVTVLTECCKSTLGSPCSLLLTLQLKQGMQTCGSIPRNSVNLASVFMGTKVADVILTNLQQRYCRRQ